MRRFELCNEGVNRLCSDPYCNGHSQTHVVDTKTGNKMLVSNRANYRDILSVLNFALECMESEKNPLTPIFDEDERSNPT